MLREQSAGRPYRDQIDRHEHTLPHDDSSFDATLALLRDGYEFIPKRARRLNTEVFETRLMLRRTICLTGREAAKLFYDESRFRRRDAVPERFKKTLFGEGGVQGLDGEPHHWRKAAFMSLMTRPAIERLVAGFTQEWRRAMSSWRTRSEIELFREAELVLCRAVCRWAGLVLEPARIELLTRQLSAMIDGSGAIGPRHWRGRLARSAAESWLMQIIEEVREGKIQAPSSSALMTFAGYVEADGLHLEPRVAAVELLNVLRPVVAVARYIAFLAHALHMYPEAASPLSVPSRDEQRDDAARERFVLEVRRLYPFFPAVAAVTRRAFEWHGHVFPADVHVLLDLYGTNRDPEVWQAPEVFWPERFAGRLPGPFELVPQGGGDPHTGHRCAGEWLTIALMREALRLLTLEMHYRVPEQDLRIKLSRIPAIPRSRVLLREVSGVR